jgi:hypothetical protein
MPHEVKLYFSDYGVFIGLEQRRWQFAIGSIVTKLRFA